MLANGAIRWRYVWRLGGKMREGRWMGIDEKSKGVRVCQTRRAQLLRQSWPIPDLKKSGRH